MKNLVVATDYSKAASNAVEYAALLAQRTEAKVTLVHVYTLAVPSRATASSLYTVKKKMAEEQERLDNLAHDLSRTFSIQVEAVSTNCPIEQELNRQVIRQKADLVVLGMKGESVSRNFLGSIATYVVRHARYPVLVVPESAIFSRLQNIVFAVDAKHQFKAAQLGVLQALALHFHSHIQALHVITPFEVNLQQAAADTEPNLTLKTLLQECRLSYQQVQAATVVEGLETGISRLGADLVVMVPHHHKFWYFLFGESKTKKMALSTHVPLLILNERPQRLSTKREEQKESRAPRVSSKAAQEPGQERVV